MMRSLGVEIRLGRGHSSVAITGKTDLITGSSIYHQSNQNRLARKRKLNLKTPSKHPSLDLSFTPGFSTSSSPRGAGRGEWGLQAVQCVSTALSPLHGEYFSCSSLAPPCGASRCRRFSTTRVLPIDALGITIRPPGSCSSMGPFHKCSPSARGCFSPGSPRGSRFLTANLLQQGLPMEL